MIFLFCRNRVKDYDRWRVVFAAHAPAHRTAGLELTGLWRSLADPNNVFFSFTVQDREKARAFLADPTSAEAGDVSGVVEGEFHFVVESSGS